MQLDMLTSSLIVRADVDKLFGVRSAASNFDAVKCADKLSDRQKRW